MLRALQAVKAFNRQNTVKLESELRLLFSKKTDLENKKLQNQSLILILLKNKRKIRLHIVGSQKKLFFKMKLQNKKRVRSLGLADAEISYSNYLHIGFALKTSVVMFFKIKLYDNFYYSFSKFNIVSITCEIILKQ